MAKKMTKEEASAELVASVLVDKRDTLIKILKLKTPGIFEREPAPAFTPHLIKLADEIISLFN